MVSECMYICLSDIDIMRHVGSVGGGNCHLIQGRNWGGGRRGRLSPPALHTLVKDII